MLAPSASIRISAGVPAGILVALAMATSGIVFSEPAVADALMLGVIVGVPILGAGKLGRAGLTNLVLWLAIVGLGLAAACQSTTMETAISHQLVTLFLAFGGVVIGAYIAADPEPRFPLVMTFYVVGCLVATAAALAGYFRFVPSAYDLFTNYGRARGTFKDPNVYGAALAPALVYGTWILLRGERSRARLAAAVSLVLAAGLLLSFSRGAWISTAVSAALLGWIALVTGRRRTDKVRFGVVAFLATCALAVALAAALQLDAVTDLLDQRASLDQSYDKGPEGRFGGQAKAVGLILDHPFGIGTHSFRDTYHHEEPHNVYLSMFLNAGWLGGFLYIVVVAGTLVAGLRGAMRRGALQGPFVVAAAAFAGVAFEGFVIDTDHWRHFFLLMGLIWGLADSQAPLIDPARRRTDPPLATEPAEAPS